MWRQMLKVALATAAFGAVHSALASRMAKQTAADLFGLRNRNGLYRIFFLSQSVATCGILVAYIRSLPSRDLYRLQGLPRLMMHLVQAGGVIYATAAARQVGILRISGLASLEQWLADGPVEPEPEAQGPALDDKGKLAAHGPFASSRHPLNFSPLPILWFWPHMTTSLLAFNATATVYLVIGSVHEEARLRAAYGDQYEEYLQSGIAFYVPDLPRIGPGDGDHQIVSPRAAETTART